MCRSELATGSSASETASPEASAAETASETSASEPAMERSCHGRETAKAGAVVERFVMGTGYGMPAFRAAVIDRVMFYALEPVNPDIGNSYGAWGYVRIGDMCSVCGWNKWKSGTHP